MNTEINLLRNEFGSTGPFGGPKGIASLYVLIAVLVIEGLLYGGLALYERQLARQQMTAEIQAGSIDMEIGTVQADLGEALGYQQRLRNLQLLLYGHLFWSPVFEELEKYTFKPITYDTLAGSIEESKVVVTGTASSFSDIGKLILGLESSENIQNVMFQSSGQAKGEQAGYGFSLELTFDPKVFQK